MMTKRLTSADTPLSCTGALLSGTADELQALGKVSNVVSAGSTEAPSASAAAAAASEAASGGASAAESEQRLLSRGDVGADDTVGGCPALIPGCSKPGK